MKVSSETGFPHDLAHFLEVERAKALLQDVMIPPCPNVLMEVLNEQGRADISFERFDEIISSDVALAAGTLKVVNSPFFGMRQRIGSIPHAVRLLGIGNVVNIVIGLMFQSAFQHFQGPFMDAYWAASNRLAMTATLVARATGKMAPDEAFALGLLCNCGIPLMYSRFGNYRTVYTTAQQAPDRTFSAVEDIHLGTTHTAAGYMLATSWKLPATFCDAILRHHDVADYYAANKMSEATGMLAVVKLALVINRRLDGREDGYEWLKTEAMVLPFLGLDADGLDTLTAEAARLLTDNA